VIAVIKLTCLYYENHDIDFGVFASNIDGFMDQFGFSDLG